MKSTTALLPCIVAILHGKINPVSWLWWWIDGTSQNLLVYHKFRVDYIPLFTFVTHWKDYLYQSWQYRRAWQANCVVKKGNKLFFVTTIFVYFEARISNYHIKFCCPTTCACLFSDNALCEHCTHWQTYTLRTPSKQPTTIFTMFMRPKANQIPGNQSYNEP